MQTWGLVESAAGNWDAARERFRAAARADPDMAATYTAWAGMEARAAAAAAAAAASAAARAAAAATGAGAGTGAGAAAAAAAVAGPGAGTGAGAEARQQDVALSVTAGVHGPPGAVHQQQQGQQGQQGQGPVHVHPPPAMAGAAEAAVRRVFEEGHAADPMHVPLLHVSGVPRTLCA